ncbi:MAG: thioredoxin [Nitrospirae bacterium]|nr:thioredoxin [Nitrospirota bacterium]
MGKVLSVDNSTWDKEVLSADGLVMVDFWAVWCGPCQMVSPIVEELASEYEGKIKVLKLNTDDNPEIASRYQIMSIPTLNFFKDGKVIDRIVGAAPKKQFKEKIDQILSKV